MFRAIFCPPSGVATWHYVST